MTYTAQDHLARCSDPFCAACLATIEANETKRQPVDVELFRRTAPAWNCVDFEDGMHYTPGDACLWCGKTREQIALEPPVALHDCGICQLPIFEGDRVEGYGGLTCHYECVAQKR